MEFFIKASQLFTSLSILIVLHELGHFIPARLFKTRVEKFYLFFDPWFSVIKKKIGNTEYGIGWLPFGGYVKISGMIDESMDKEQMNLPPKPWEFRSKPAWQRLIIMSGGVIINLLLGVFIYSMTLFYYGDKYLPNKNLTDGVWCVSELGESLGFKTGDKIITADGVEIIRFSDVLEKVMVSKKITVSREGQLVELTMPVDLIDQFLNSNEKMIFYPRVPTIIGSFTEGSELQSSGFLIKDQIIGINGAPIKYYDSFKKEIENHKGSPVLIEIVRGGSRLNLTANVNEDGFLGFKAAIPSINQLEELGVCQTAYVNYSFFGSFPAGYNKAIKKLNSYIDQFALILSPSTGAYKGLGGFGAIGSMFPAKWNWEVFWNVTAFISIILAFMNILPIPALDGGHILFLLYEMVAGRPAPEKIIEYAQIIGVVLLLSLVAYANLNDIFRLL